MVLRAAPSFRLLEIGLTIDGECVMTYRGDGVIVATPGGLDGAQPVGGRADPAARRPHVRRSRPSARTRSRRGRWSTARTRCFELTSNNPDGSTYLVIDGQVQIPLDHGDRDRGPPRHVGLPDGPPAGPVVLPHAPGQARLGKLAARQARGAVVTLNQAKS